MTGCSSWLVVKPHPVRAVCSFGSPADSDRSPVGFASRPHERFAFVGNALLILCSDAAARSLGVVHVPVSARTGAPHDTAPAARLAPRAGARGTGSALV